MRVQVCVAPTDWVFSVRQTETMSSFNILGRFSYPWYRIRTKNVLESSVLVLARSLGGLWEIFLSASHWLSLTENFGVVELRVGYIRF